MTRNVARVLVPYTSFEVGAGAVARSTKGDIPMLIFFDADALALYGALSRLDVTGGRERGRLGQRGADGVCGKGSASHEESRRHADQGIR